MQVLGISGSMRRDGNTALLVKAVLDHCHASGVHTEFVSLAGLEIKPCTGCEKCKKSKECVVVDDDWHAVIDKVMDCDVLVIGSPTYYFDVCGHLKNFIDRTYSLYHDRSLSGKKAVIVTVHATKGSSRAQETLEGFLGAHEFSFLGAVSGVGYHEGDVLKDKKAIEGAEKIAGKIMKLLRTRG